MLRGDLRVADPPTACMRLVNYGCPNRAESVSSSVTDYQVPPPTRAHTVNTSYMVQTGGEKKNADARERAGWGRLLPFKLASDLPGLL